MLVSCRKFSDAVMTIFSGQSVISRVHTSRFGNGSLGTPAEVVLKKYQVHYSVEKPPKVNRTELYRAVPCSGKAPYVLLKAAVRNFFGLKMI